MIAGYLLKGVKMIPLSRGMFALVDEEDYKWLNEHKWYASETRKGDGNFYAKRSVVIPGTSGRRNRTVYMHRVIVDCPEGMEVDHRNENSLCNRRGNLRTCNRRENMSRRWKYGVRTKTR